MNSALGIEAVAWNARVENNSVFSGVVTVMDISLESRQPDVTAECRNTTSTRIIQWFVSLVNRLVEVSLQVQRCRGYAIGEHYALPVEVGEGCSLLYVCHHGRIVHLETAVGPAATAPIRQHGEEGFFVDGVLTLVQTLRAALVSRAETVVRLAAQTNESVPAPFHLEQTGRPLVERLACETTRLSGRPRASSQSGLDVFILVLVAAFGRQPFGSVAIVMLALFRSDEIVNALAC